MKAFNELIVSLQEIKRQKRAMAASGVDKATARELVLYITNDGQLYRGRTSAIIKNLHHYPFYFTHTWTIICICILDW